MAKYESHEEGGFPLPDEDPAIDISYRQTGPNAQRFYDDRLSDPMIREGVPENAFRAGALALELDTPEVFDRVRGRIETGHATDTVATQESWKKHHPDGMAPGEDISGAEQLIDPRELTGS